MGNYEIFPWACSERCPMPLSKNRISVIVRMALLIWGGLSLMRGAGLEFFISESDPYLHSAGAFIYLVYGALFWLTLLSFLSVWIASLLLLISVIASSAILIWTNAFGHGLPWAAPFIWDIALRPALGSLVLFILSRWVKEPPIVSKWRSVIRKERPL